MSDAHNQCQTTKQSPAGASMTFPVKSTTLCKNDHVVIEGRPCKIVDMSRSRAGRRIKVYILGIDEGVFDSTHNVDVPNLHHTEYQLVNLDDGFLNLLTQDGTAKDDVKVPKGDLGIQIQANFDEGKDLLITILSAMGEEKAISYKEAPRSN